MQVGALNERFQTFALRFFQEVVHELILSKTAAVGVAVVIFCISLLQPGLAQAAPTITGISHSTGSIGGGTTVTITGTEFTGATSVTFGVLAAGDVTVVNATTITAVTPARVLPGSVTVAVTTPTGTASRANFFTYILTPAPTVLLGTPLIGSTAGGTSVVLTGANFTGATSVSFGGTSTTDFTVVNPATITVRTPPHAAGLVSVGVTGPGGTGIGLGLFTYVPAPPTVLLVAPLIGPTVGGTSVTITGLNFSGASAVSFGGTAATGFTILNDTTITATTPAHAAGLVNVAVTTAGGTGTGIGLFTYLPAPPASLLATPLTGPAAGGTVVTITGLNLSGATAVTFGGTAAASFSVINDLTITAATPPHAAGVVDITVTTAGGIGTGIGRFTYLPADAPSAVIATPLIGSSAGGTPVTITGSNFTGVTSVNFGSSPATNVTVVNDNTITANAPPHAAGLVRISVTSPAGTGLSTGLFTYLPLANPSVLLATPLAGPLSGGTSVTLTGANFTGATAVSFGNTPATSFTVVNDNTITAVSPAHAVGLVGITVTSQGTGTGAGLFTYLPTDVPSVLAALPLTGPASGGTPVTLTGLNFTGATAVTFGGTPATGVTVVSDTTITAIAPAHAAGIVNVSVTSPAGTGLGLGLFTYMTDPVPTVLLASTLTGPETGGTSVTITGLNFTGATAVKFGNATATTFIINSVNSITVTTPAHPPGLVDISVTSSAGTGLGLGLFTYLPTSIPSAIVALPATGPASGGTVVTLSGSDFTGATAVSFGGTDATSFTVVNNTTIRAITPSHTAGVVDVKVTGSGTLGTGTGFGAFIYLPTAAPSVLSATPLAGPVTGSTSVTIVGGNFTGATGVSFGGTSALSFTVVNDNRITALTPPHAAGLAAVSVTSPNGTGLLSGLFAYLPAAPPQVALVAPPIGPKTGGTVVTITGINFFNANNAATVVKFGTRLATDVEVVNDTTIRATAPAATAAGIVSVSVETAAGLGTSSGVFTYLPTAQPIVTLATPAFGDNNANTSVTIKGLNFTGATAVHFGDTAATGFTVVDDETITTTAPPHPTGIVNISVTTQAGTGLGLGLFAYLPVSQPTVLAVTPAAGPAGGGVSVTITGTNFTGATEVLFGTNVASGMTVINDNTIVATTPAATSAGVVNVKVTSSKGTGEGLGLYVYLPSVPPSSIAVLPPFGPSGGGSVVNIKGVALTGTTSVRFGGIAATSFRVIDDITIEAVTPPHPPGIVDVSLTSPAGTGLGAAAFTYRPTAPPTVLAALPPTGPSTGGTQVTIIGANFTGATAVNFGPTVMTDFDVLNDTTIMLSTPGGPAGIVNVSVTSPAGTEPALGLFTYLPALPPTNLVITPALGPATGGTPVSIKGINLTGVTSVSFDGTPATGVTVVNDGEVTAISPAHAVGSVPVAVPVRVTSPAGSSLLPTLFVYEPTLLPTVLLVTPPIGTTAGGTSVTITGLNLSGVTSVSFGGVPAQSFSVLNATTISAVSPPNNLGVVNISVTSSNGPGIGLGLFTYLPVDIPVVALVTPPFGPPAGGTVVTITGLNFTGATNVHFGTTQATGFTVVNDTTITAVAPAHALGIVNVTVTTPAGPGIGLGLFSYLPTSKPTVGLVTPFEGPTSGGTQVAITGLNLTGATDVSFGGTPASSFTVNSDTSITATSPPHAAGIVRVTVTTPAGSGISTGSFTYLPATRPIVLLAAPLVGPATGGTTVTITGLNFTGVTSVSFGGVAATGVNFINDGVLTAITPAHTAGIVDVRISSANGDGIGLGLFTYLPAGAATVTAVAPDSGPTIGGTNVTITGTNFNGTTGVNFGNVPATNVTVIDDMTITATSPAHVAGITDISVTSPAGNGIGRGLFTYTPAIQPTVIVAAPSSGPSFGGTQVTITGANFGGVTSVGFGGTPATAITVVNNSTVTATAPPHADGLVDISVSSPAGTGLGFGLFTYLTATAPNVASLSPTTGPVAGGTVVTITGSSFTGTTAVTFGGAAASNITVINDQTVTVISPARSAGSVVVSITTPAGTAIAASLFTYTEPLRPNPALDQEVIGLVNAQAASATRFARNQMRNFHGRLERLHNERDRIAASMDIRLGLPSQQRRDRQDRNNDSEDVLDELVSRKEKASTSYGYGSGGQSPLGSLANAGASNGPASDTREYSKLAFWSGGFVNFGNGDDEGFDIGHTTVGISGGVDYRFTDRFVAGIGIGYGRDRADIGDNGTESKAQAFSAAVYSSFEIIDDFFLDALVGGSTLSFDSKRYVTANGEFATGNRSGSQIFASVTAAYEIREETWLVSPYGRVEFSRSFLDRYSEEGGGIYSLTYGGQTIDTVSGVIGLRANMSFETDWAVLTPGLRLEYTHDFEGTSDTKLGYKDLGTLPYEIEGRESRQDFITVGLSLDMQFDNNWDLAFEYRARFGNEGDTDHNVGVQLRAKF